MQSSGPVTDGERVREEYHCPPSQTTIGKGRWSQEGESLVVRLHHEGGWSEVWSEVDDRVQYGQTLQLRDWVVLFPLGETP